MRQHHTLYTDNFHCRCDYYEEDTWCEVYLKVKAPSHLALYDEDFAMADWVVIEEDDSTEEMKMGKKKRVKTAKKAKKAEVKR